VKVIAPQYGLIAEEVAKFYPELVIRDGNGRIDGMRYDELVPMLLNEVQQQEKSATIQAERIAAPEKTNAAQSADIRDSRKLVVEMQTGLAKLQAQEQLVAQPRYL
jgi:hypothetical protein